MSDKIIVSLSLFDAIDQATETFAHDNFIFKIGEKAMGKLSRSITATG